MEHLKLITMRVWELRDHGDRDEYRGSHRMGMREYEDAHELRLFLGDESFELMKSEVETYSSALDLFMQAFPSMRTL